MKTLDKKVGEFTLLDSFIIASSKIGTEAVLGKIDFVGNGTYRSGLIKTIGAVAISMLSRNKYIQYLASGMLLDGMEDIAINLKGLVPSGNTSVTTNEVIL